MLGIFRNLLGTAKEVEVPGMLEKSGGLEILRATPRRMGLVEAIRDALETLAGNDLEAPVDEVLSRFASWIYDLPASHSNHHSGRFGLLDHTLEAACRTVRRLSRTAFRVSPDPVADHRERPSWVYAGFLGAVAHDLGKVFDFEVVLPDTDIRWKPEAEPLHAFLARHGHLETGPALWRFRPDRGFHDHGEKNGFLLPRLLVPQAVHMADPRLDPILRAWRALEKGEACKDVSEVVLRIAAVIRESDILSAREEPKERSASAPSATETNDANIPSPPSPLPVVESQTSTSVAPSEGENDIVFKESPHEKVPVLKEVSFEMDPESSMNVGAGGPRKTRGDPTEQERRLQVELDPVRLLDTLRRAVLRRLLGRNRTYMEVFIRQDYVWFMLPKALIRIATLNRLFPTQEVLARMIRSIGECPLAAPGEDGNLILNVRILPEALVQQAVRLRTRGFLPESDLERLGFWTKVIEVCAESRRADPMSWKKEATVVPL